MFLRSIQYLCTAGVKSSSELSGHSRLTLALRSSMPQGPDILVSFSAMSKVRSRTPGVKVKTVWEVPDLSFQVGRSVGPLAVGA